MTTSNGPEAVAGMEHTIEQAEALVYGVFDDAPDEGLDSFDFAREIVRTLTEAGLIAPAPLTEEWGSEVRDVRPGRDPYVLYAHDPDNAQWQIEHNPDYATGRIMHRYRTDWLPVVRAEGDGRADQ